MCGEVIVSIIQLFSNHAKDEVFLDPRPPSKHTDNNASRSLVPVKHGVVGFD